MGWLLLLSLVGALAVCAAVLGARRREVRRMVHVSEERRQAKERGSHEARLQYPHIDLSRCLGCGTCVRSCPEEGVLDLVHGQAVVVHGSRCVGHGRCAEECPADAITITLGNLQERRDIPALDEFLEVEREPGLFLAGEVTGFSLIRTAIAHGQAIASMVALRREDDERELGSDVLDLCIVGAGPAGIACSLEAKARGLSFVTLEQDQLGGTVSKYPRRKLVMTQPVDLPLHGRLTQTSYSKEELMELWQELVERYELDVRTGIEFQGLEKDATGVFNIATSVGPVRARSACVAIGRRGIPRTLGVPGEELPKVCYSLIDAQAYSDRRIVVVGGGDSAIEAALALAAQPGNRVVLSYRQKAFTRLKGKNEQAIGEAIAERLLHVEFESTVKSIEPERILIECRRPGAERVVAIPNDEVFVLAGGVPPFELLERCGVSFDPADRPAPCVLGERGTGLLRALTIGTLLSVLALAWALLHHDYYGLERFERAVDPRHRLLDSSTGAGLGFGIAAVVFMLVNLAYLLRRRGTPIAWGSLSTWMTSHVLTGTLALLTAILHSGLNPQRSIGGHALTCMAVLTVTGAVGRYLYSFVPRSANGRELESEEVSSQLAALASEWDLQDKTTGRGAREAIEQVVRALHWERGPLARLCALLTTPWRLRSVLRRIAVEARAQGVSEQSLDSLSALARRAQRVTLSAAYYEDVRAVLSSWRFFHRWVALLIVLLVIAHIAVALRYGGYLG